MSIQDGTRLGRYEIRTKIGEGGMGEVYLARDTKLDRNVAIKFLPPDSIDSEQAHKRLLREARAAATLDHPNICAVHEVAEEESRSFIVMQYVDGETLEVRMGKQRLDLATSVAIAVHVADALAEAHAHGIIHRDIKPANIMITSRGQPKVMDFGLAKTLEPIETTNPEAVTKSLLTTPGMIVGTVPYMSPEQVKGEKVDARTDIFSFGTMLYEMITGKNPFVAKTTAEIISAILTVDPPALKEFSGAIPVRLDQIVHKCVQKDRERRYQTMRDVFVDLDTVRRECELGTSPLQSANPRVTERPTVMMSTPGTNTETTPASALWSRRGLALGVILLLAAVITAYAVFNRSARTKLATSNPLLNSPAYDSYIRGKVMVRSENPPDIDIAIQLLEKAVAADPNFAPAWAELAAAYNRKTFFYAPRAERKQLIVTAEVAAEKALALDPNLAEGHFARGLILWTHEKGFPHEQVIQSYKRAIALNPNLDEAHHQLAVVYIHIGLLDKAWAEIEKVMEIKPTNTMARFRFGVVHMYRINYEQALATFKTIPREANPPLVDRNLSEALFYLGRTDEAASVVDEYLKTYSNDEGGSVTSVKALLLAKAGRTQEAEETIRRAVEIGKYFGHFHHTAFNVAAVYSILNKPDDAIKWLQTAADDGFPCYPYFEKHAILNNLRNHDGFKTFMAKLKQQWEKYNSTL